jgi:hypothetical protein
MSNIKQIIIEIEKDEYWAMFTVKHWLPYKSYVKGDNKGWLQNKMSQMTSTIYLSKKVVNKHMCI